MPCVRIEQTQNVKLGTSAPVGQTSAWWLFGGVGREGNASLEIKRPCKGLEPAMQVQFDARRCVCSIHSGQACILETHPNLQRAELRRRSRNIGASIVNGKYI